MKAHASRTKQSGESCLPGGNQNYVYAEHDSMLPYSPTTLKKTKNKMSKQTTVNAKAVKGKLQTICFDLSNIDLLN